MELAKLGHVAYTTPDLERSVWFFRDVVGLEEVERHQDTVFLRAWGDWEHHTLSLARGDQALVDHVAWRTKRPEDVEEFAGRLKSQGTEVEWIEAGAERGQGRAIRFELPSGNTFELYYEMEKTPAPEHRKSRLKNLPSRAFDRGISPRRIDHVNINVPDPPHVHRWLDENLGFKMREYLRLDKSTASRLMTWRRTLIWLPRCSRMPPGPRGSTWRSTSSAVRSGSPESRCGWPRSMPCSTASAGGV